MEIYRVEDTDIEDVKGVAKKAILESVEVGPDLVDDVIEDTMQHIDAYLSHRSGVFLKCEMNGALVGFILIKDYWNLSDMFVLPECHGKGAGKALFAEAVKICRTEGEGKPIRSNSSLNAVGFYRSLGFEGFTPSKALPDFVKPLVYSDFSR